MPTEVEIKTNYKSQHYVLSERYYKLKEIDKATFDSQHGQLWNDYRDEMVAEGYMQIPVPQRDLLQEIDALKARIGVLESK